MVHLDEETDTGWARIATGSTDDDGRVGRLGPELATGTYRLVFEAQVLSPLFTEIHVVVSLTAADGHYHVPVLASPYGYTTYRGS
jgi:5-hydroxyisourate hydrolase-like protein (transthyretin family)